MRRRHWPTEVVCFLAMTALGFVVLLLGAPLWFAFVALMALRFAWRLWAAPPALCHMCVRGRHPHELDGRCIAGYCECAVREPALDGETR